MDVEFTEKLIQEVRNRPTIYLLSHKDYKNNTKKLQAWREIQGILNEEVPALKAKWKNLKDTYKKYKQSKNTSSGQAAKKLQNWAWADHMTFIEPSVSLNETESSIALPNEEHSHTPASNSVVLEENENRQESDVSGTQNAQQIYRRHRKHNLDPTDRMIQYLQNRPRNRNTNNDERVDVKCDGTDLLFLGYADAFKKLSKRKQVSVKFDIARILMEAELDDLTPERNSISSDTQNSLVNVASPDSYVAPHTPGNYSMIGTQDNSIINATSTDNYVAPLTPGNYSMISDATINDAQDNTDHYILPHNSQATDLTTNNLNTANMRIINLNSSNMNNTNFNSTNMNNTNYNSAANYNSCSRFFSEFQ